MYPFVGVCTNVSTRLRDGQLTSKRSRRILNAWRFQFNLNLVVKVQWIRLGGWRCSPIWSPPVLQVSSMIKSAG